MRLAVIIEPSGILDPGFKPWFRGKPEITNLSSFQAEGLVVPPLHTPCFKTIFNHFQIRTVQGAKGL